MKKSGFLTLVSAFGALLALSAAAYAAPAPNLSKTPRGQTQQAFLGRPSCLNAVNFKYVKPSHKVENHRNIQGFTRKKLRPNQKLGGQTRFSGLTWTIKNVQRGCGRGIEIRVQHRAPIRVIMPDKKSMLSCNYNGVLKHEMEHVAIYRDTPQEYEKKFKAILSTSNGAAASNQLGRLAGEISAEMKRRNDRFHDKHGAILYLKKGCG